MTGKGRLPRNARRGFIFLIVLTLVVVVFTLGAWYLYSTLQSKNLFQAIYRDDIARLFVESAVAEWRGTFQQKLGTQAALQRLLAAPTQGNAVPLTLSDLPQTSALLNRIAGSGRAELTGTIEVKNTDDRLDETMSGVTKRSTFQGEYQGTLRLTLRVGLGPSGHRRWSAFLYEFDLKRTCLRSKREERNNAGYTSSSLNDYVLFVRDCRNEFDSFNGRSLNNDSRTLVLAHADQARKGRIFLGCARPSDEDKASKYVFFNVNERMESMIPDAPPPTLISWSALKASDMMPKFTQRIEQILNEAQQSANGQANFFPDRIKATISLEFKPLVGSQGWWQGIVARIRSLFDHFFAKFRNAREGNKEKGLHVLGANDMDLSMCQLIEGNVRQRFWQTSTFKLDLSEVSDNNQVKQEIINKCGDRLDLNLKFFSNSEIDLMLRTIDQQTVPEEIFKREIYRVVKNYQTRDNNILMSMPNPLFPFKVKPNYETERNAEGTFPNPPLKSRTGSSDFTEFLPFSPFLVRSYRFRGEQDLYSSMFYDAERNILKLQGIFLVESPVTLRKDLKYEGAGVILAYGDITVEGSLTRASPTAGPCVLYTYLGNISANKVAQGPIHASLVALHWQYNPTNLTSPHSFVDFNRRKAEVLGNLVVDRINLDSMSPDQTNTITYDGNVLLGDTIFSVTLGGRLRAMRIVYDDESAAN